MGTLLFGSAHAKFTCRVCKKKSSGAVFECEVYADEQFGYCDLRYLKNSKNRLCEDCKHDIFLPHQKLSKWFTLETVQQPHVVCSKKCEERMTTKNAEEQKKMQAAMEKHRQHMVARDAVAAAARFRNPAPKKDDVENIPIANKEKIKAICSGFNKKLIEAAAAAAQQRVAAIE